MQKQSPLWQQTARSYFIFSRSQRRALAFCITCMLAYAAWYAYKLQQISRSMVNVPFVAVQVRSELVALDTGSFNNSSYPANNSNGYSFATYTNSGSEKEVMDKNKLHPFDPNTAGEAELLAMGLRPGVVKTLLNYRSKGGKFRKPEDLGKLYGLKEEESALLIPFVTIESEQDFANNYAEKEPLRVLSAPAGNKTNFEIPVVDVNKADSFSLTVLPAIGTKRAALIVKYRESLGGFTHHDQLKEVFGINDSVYNAIKPYVHLSKDGISRINLNTVTEARLKKHPYIGYKLGGIIINYRQQHGSFKSVDDLLKIYIIKPEWLERVRPYLAVE